MNVRQANENLNHKFSENYGRGMGGLPEACEPVNNASRKVVEAMRDEHGEAWLGLVNCYNQSQKENPLWKWNGQLVQNFAAGFVVPCDDECLRQIIAERHNGEGYCPERNFRTVKEIQERVGELGGVMLVWS